MDQMDQTVPSSSPPHHAKTLLVVFLVFGLLGLVVGGVYFGGFGAINTQEQQEAGEEATEQSLAPNIIVYGNWQNKNQTAIKAYNLQTGNTTTLARLGEAVKKITLLSPETLLYINKTDARDHGKEMVVYSISKKSGEVVYKADNGFGIDDYVVSPDGKSVAVWEVRFPQNSGILRNGSSRVYAATIGKSSKNRLYDEVQVGEIPVHYQRAITDSGQVFLDTFLPNSGAGWAYGMSVSNFTGTQKQDLTNMQNGTYGTQPVLSPDGKYLAFAGYDGAYGTGVELIDGFRRALIRSNTIELLNTQTLERQKLQNLSNANIYSNVRWDTISEKLVYDVISKTENVSGTHAYDVAGNQDQKLSLGLVNQDEPIYILASYLSNGGMLVGALDISDSALGNLGDAYGAPYTELGVIVSTPSPGQAP